MPHCQVLERSHEITFLQYSSSITLFDALQNFLQSLHGNLGPGSVSISPANINNSMVGIESEIRLFADDCVCYRQIDHIEDTSKFQMDIDQVGKWARK